MCLLVQGPNVAGAHLPPGEMSTIKCQLDAYAIVVVVVAFLLHFGEYATTEMVMYITYNESSLRNPKFTSIPLTTMTLSVSVSLISGPVLRVDWDSKSF